IGYRPIGYEPKLVEYALYEKARKDLLTPQRAQAALKQGGLIWRLAREVYPDLEVAVDVVLNTPIPHINTDLKFSREVNRQNINWFDSGLTEEEENLICGVYKVYADETNKVIADVSWWPKPSAWITSGLNVGYWSPDAEEWFRKRLECIQRGEAKLYNAGAWKKAIKFRKTALDFSKQHEALNTAFL
ncbi:hypothetical protein BDN72DRAFT_752055, partial [Pluteus cervinus]